MMGGVNFFMAETTENEVKEEVKAEAVNEVLPEEEEIVFTGTNYHSVDDKNRVKIPSDVRDSIKGRFRLARGNDHVIYLYSASTANQVLKRVNKALKQPGLTTKQVSALKKYLSSYTVEMEEDAQGRFVLPQSLMTWAQLSKKCPIVTIGAGDHFEIWSAAKYEEFMNDNDGYEECLSELGIY